MQIGLLECKDWVAGVSFPQPVSQLLSTSRHTECTLFVDLDWAALGSPLLWSHWTKHDLIICWPKFTGDESSGVALPLTLCCLLSTISHIIVESWIGVSLHRVWSVGQVSCTTMSLQSKEALQMSQSDAEQGLGVLYYFHSENFPGEGPVRGCEVYLC